MEAVKKIGRPRKYKESPVGFGIKITTEEKNKITAEGLLKMPKDLSSRVIQEQVRKSVKFFEQIEDNQEIIDY